ncbi:hypothetical protein GGS23DRAFT_579887 [Durotheca rogersii]|uniref:uncharacterized protein n=1 Tax=Durotheca rogersii TaxID=419775 RepID=UPI0022207C90|nr:uncharacterized protein GGS23DRAFT_579887 [Durotheca rogersii]KAI5860695.1 hypothetical protein GGS23DRAFT_579887 [Durotheca rogersii]
MRSMRLARLMAVALSVTTVAHATWLDEQLFGKAHREVTKRQDNPGSILTGLLSSSSSPDTPTPSTDDSDTPAPTSDNPPESTSTPPPNPPTTTSSSSQTTPTRTTQSPTSDNGPSTTPPPTSSPSSPDSQPSSTTSGGDNETSETVTTPQPQPSTSTFVTVITTTNSIGETIVTSSSSTIVSTPTVAPAESTQPPGMPDSIRNTIIGVTVGVGGAIVLGVAGVLFWRLRSKRRNQEENEELVSYGDGFGGPGTAEKTTDASGSTAGRTPFQSTLESYHAPTSTNAASNF